LVLGFVFGYAGNRSQFCAMGAVSDIVNIGDWSRMRMWLLAMAVAILGAAVLQLAGLIDVGKSIYATPNLLWLSHLVGGALFGVGMTLASGCGSRSLIRLGGGNLKSLIVLIVLAISAYMTLRGLFGVFRVRALDSVAVTLPAAQDLPSLAAAALGAGRPAMLALSALVFGAGLLYFVFRDRDFRTRSNVLGGLAIGLTVVAGWYLSGHIGYLAEDPETLEERFLATNSGRMESLSFVSPHAYLLELLMFWSDRSRVVTFGIAAVVGVVAGSFAWALQAKAFRLESFRDARDLLNHLAGGVLMGFGGVVALGCTIGQGLSGVSTLALGSILTFFAIVAGAVATMKYQYWRAEASVAGANAPISAQIR
jgi:uncharacterized membrane protein YedE/YeeE